MGTNPASVALADVNGDGKLDIVTANSASQTVSVLLNNGSGTFANQVTYTVGMAPLSVVIADLNGDEKPDLAVANSTGVDMFGTVSVLLGVGDGTFQNQVTYGVGQTPSWLTVGDVDGDGHLDLITANSGVSGDAPFGGVSVLRGKGDGTFTVGTVETPSRPYSVAVADFNKDGRLDLVSAELIISDTIYSQVGGLILQLAKTDGTFSTAADVEFDPGNAATFLASVDLNGDGNPGLRRGSVPGGQLRQRVSRKRQRWLPLPVRLSRVRGHRGRVRRCNGRWLVGPGGRHERQHRASVSGKRRGELQRAGPLSDELGGGSRHRELER